MIWDDSNLDTETPKNFKKGNLLVYLYDNDKTDMTVGKTYIALCDEYKEESAYFINISTDTYKCKRSFFSARFELAKEDDEEFEFGFENEEYNYRTNKFEVGDIVICNKKSGKRLSGCIGRVIGVESFSYIDIQYVKVEFRTEDLPENYLNYSGKAHYKYKDDYDRYNTPSGMWKKRNDDIFDKDYIQIQLTSLELDLYNDDDDEFEFGFENEEYRHLENKFEIGDIVITRDFRTLNPENFEVIDKSNIKGIVVKVENVVGVHRIDWTQLLHIKTKDNEIVQVPNSRVELLYEPDDDSQFEEGFELDEKIVTKFKNFSK